MIQSQQTDRIQQDSAKVEAKNGGHDGGNGGQHALGVQPRVAPWRPLGLVVAVVVMTIVNFKVKVMIIK